MGRALGPQFEALSLFLTALPRREKRRLVPLREQPPFGALRRGRPPARPPRPSGPRSAPATAQGAEGGPRRWSLRLFLSLSSYVVFS